MKRKFKVLVIPISIISVVGFASLPILNNIHSFNHNCSQLNSSNKNSKLIKKTFDARLIGAQDGTFTIEYSDVDHCKIVDVNRKFSAYGYFDFNGGKFTRYGVTYTITEIGTDAFYTDIHLKFFYDVYLTIPSTIKKIGKNAFENCSRTVGDKGIRAINFEEGVEYISSDAFESCNDIKEKYIKLPNSLKYMNYDAFRDTRVEIIDLTALDHVIEMSNERHHDWEGKIWAGRLKKIYVKNKKIQQEYLEAKSWRLTPEVFEVKEVSPIPPLTKLTIDARLIGGDTGDVTLDVKDPKNSIILKCNSDFSAKGNFNFKGSYFTAGGITYKIAGIAKKAFHHTTGSSYTDFYETNLVIPSTIKYIGDESFYNNSRLVGRKEIISIHFEEGVEYIGKSAFEKCNDISQDTLKLPNSLKKLGNRAFVNTGNIECFDLTALDHVIDIDCDPLSKNGCLPTKQIEKILFNDETTMNLYLNDKYWKSCARYFGINEIPPTPIKELTINASKIGAKNGSVTLDIANPNNCIIKKVSNDFKATGDFNFNDGKFIHDNKTYTITKIDDNVFKSSDENYSFFENCNLRIPSTIKEIGKEAFANYLNSNISKFNSINFENGIKSIGECAFANALSIDSNHLLELPPTIKYLGNQAFENDYLNEIELSYIESSIEVDSNVLGKNGCFANNNVSKIYVKSEKIKEKYLNSNNWKSCKDIIKVKDSPIPIEKNIINITLTNGTTWKFDAKYIDGLWNEFTKDIVLGDKTFQRNSIKTVSFSNINNLINIEKCFLKGCNNLETIDLSGLNNLQTIDDFFLANCPNVKNVVLPESLVSIGNDFLKANTTIEEIILNTPNLKSVGFSFLEGCTNVKIVDLSNIKNNFIQYRYNFAGDSAALEHVYINQSLLNRYLQDEEWSSHFKDSVISIKN